MYTNLNRNAAVPGTPRQFCCHRVWEVSEGCVRNVLQVKCLRLPVVTKVKWTVHVFSMFYFLSRTRNRTRNLRPYFSRVQFREVHWWVVECRGIVLYIFTHRETEGQIDCPWAYLGNSAVRLHVYLFSVCFNCNHEEPRTRNLRPYFSRVLIFSVF